MGLRVFLSALFMALCFAAPAAAQRPALEGAQLAGRWDVTGGYTENADGLTVDFWVTINNDGTCVDRDGYVCRWILAGSAFSMYYGENGVGYVGTLSGDEISGSFVGAAGGDRFTGVFRMRHAASSGGGGTKR